MSKLDKALEDAKGHNVVEEGYDLAKDKAKDEIKGRAKDAGTKAAKTAGKKAAGGMKSAGQGAANAAKSAHGALAGKSGAYKNGAKAVAGGARKVAGAAKGLWAFITSGPVGWAVGVGLLVITLLLFGAANAPDEVAQGSNGGDLVLDDSDLTEEERILLFGGVFCPEPVYADSSSSSGGSGGLSDPNSAYYQNAKKTFEQWVGAGLSGEAAAGIIGWTSSEGDFHMIGRAEGYYRSNDPKDSSLAYGNEPIPSLSSYSVGGGGIYQFTPYTKYAPLGSPDWEDFDKMHAYLFNQIANKGDWLPAKNDYSGKNHSFREFAESTIIEDTTLAWNSYERMNRGTWEKKLPGIKDKKIAEAKLAYNLFNGSQYKFDEATFEANFGSSGEYTQKTNEGYTDPCIAGLIGGSPWGGEGGQPSIESGMWAHDSVPDELKKYAINPNSFGMQNGVAETWQWNTSGTSDQCTDLTANITKLIWEKDGKPFPNTQGMGHGGVVAKNYASQNGGKVTNLPSAGAIFSTSAGSASDSNGVLYGHTGIVSHVFDNGDFLVIEQNVGRLSGLSANQKNTWNYRIISKGKISQNNYTFFDPSSVGYRFVDGIKSL